MKNLKLAQHDPILVDLKALRRSKPLVSIDLKRPTARAEAPADLNDDAINVEGEDPLATIVALSRRKFRR
jgi:hypothetical protein